VVRFLWLKEGLVIGSGYSHFHDKSGRRALSSNVEIFAAMTIHIQGAKLSRNSQVSSSDQYC
jgi:hypothetical protein